ncbi:MAG: hypothetical protein RLZZ444_2541, partial [Pseudomonadota bacterium]
MDKNFAGWNLAVAEAVAAVGTASFAGLLETALRTILDFDILMVFAYSGSERPLCLYHNIDPVRASTVIDAYASGPYLLDPFYAAAIDPKGAGVRRLRDMAPDHFYASEYYRQHYVLTGIRDEVGIVCKPSNWTGLVVSFTRPVSLSAFGRRDLKAVRDAEPLLRLLSERHWAGKRGADDAVATGDDPAQRDPINATLSSMTNGVLTPREIEITALILRGHSNAAIAQRLGIVTGTVKIHRKNIHQKLDISSQSELFALFIREITNRF